MEKKQGGGCCGGSSKTKEPVAQLNIVPTKSASRKGQKKTGPVEAKIVLLGESGVGKSSIALRFCQDRFDELHDVTIGGAYI